MEAKTLIQIFDKEFNKIAKGCGIKYRNKIPRKELKAMLGYCTEEKRRKVEISDETGFCQIFISITGAAKTCGISSASAIKYALDNGRPFLKRRRDKKKFYVKEI